MKKFFAIVLILLHTTTRANPMFETNNKNSIGLYIVQSTGHGDLGSFSIAMGMENQSDDFCNVAIQSTNSDF